MLCCFTPKWLENTWAITLYAFLDTTVKSDRDQQEGGESVDDVEKVADWTQIKDVLIN